MVFRQSGYSFGYQVAVPSIGWLFGRSGHYTQHLLAELSCQSGHSFDYQVAISSIRWLLRRPDLHTRLLLAELSCQSGHSFIIWSLFLQSGGCHFDWVFIHLHTRLLLAELFRQSGHSSSHQVAVSLITWLFGQSGLHIHLVLAALHLLLDRRFATGSSSSSGKAVSLGEVNTSV